MTPDLERRGRCCIRCKTPYFCGNPVCRCHPDELTQLLAQQDRT